MPEYLYNIYLRLCSFKSHIITTKHIILETKYNYLTQRYEFTHIQGE